MSKNLFFIVCASLTVLMGCEGPHFWDYQISVPKEADLVGTYEIAAFHYVDRIDGFSKNDPVRIILNPDHTTEISGFPEVDPFADSVLCGISESGTWKVTRDALPQIEFHLRFVPKWITAKIQSETAVTLILSFQSWGTCRPTGFIGALATRMTVVELNSSASKPNRAANADPSKVLC